MDLEYHQLDLCNEHLRVRCPDRQRKLLASLAESGQQLPIVVVAIPNEPDRYRVIDGFKRIAALKLLGHDTVCATIWQLSEAEALVLDQSLRLSDQDTALEQGWLLAELESRFGYDLDDLARRFDRSTSWVSRRIALVEALPDSVQEQVRRGEVGAQVAMKFLVPMVRISTQACARMAAIFGRLKLQTREAGELYAAWRDASPVVRQRILDEPQLFLKAHRERRRPQQEAEARSPTSDLLRDLEMIQSIDNTHVVVLRGTSANMVPVPEMAAFAEHFGSKFAAHERGDANRSARVEAPFHFIENNFLAGRKFADWDDLNRQAREWCDRVNGTYKKHIRAVPRELFAVERLHLKPLPAWIPEVYRLHERMIDVEAFVSLHSNRYSVPGQWIGRRVEVRETRDKVEIQLGLRDLVIHKRVWDATGARYVLPEHRRPRGQGARKYSLETEERAILELVPDIADYLAALKQRTRKIPRLALRQLLRMAREYPRTPLLEAIQEAARYGLYDLDRLERMILRRIAGDYFRLNDWEENGGEDD